MSGSRGVLIIVEDDKNMRTLYRELLQREGFTVLTAANGRQARELFHTTVSPRCVLLDIGLPDINGIDLCRNARDALGPAVPIMFLTANEELEKLRAGIEAGGNDYMLKSSKASSIIDRVKLWASKGQRANLTDVDHMMAEVTAKLREAANNIKPRNLTRENDKDFAALCNLVDRARDIAHEDFGKTVEEKLYLLGYVTGLVEHWAHAQENQGVNDRFLEYLEGVVKVSHILSDQEVDYMLSALEELDSSPIYAAAHKNGLSDCEEARKRGPLYQLPGLARFEQVFKEVG